MKPSLLLSAAYALLPFTPSVAETLFRTNFNSGNPLPNRGTYSYQGAGSVAVSASYAFQGSFDTLAQATPSRALRLSTNSSGASGYWGAAVTTGLLPVSNAVSDLRLLTLAFDLTASHAAAVLVRVESFNASFVRKGVREAVVYPAGPDFPHRHTVDLGDTVLAAGNFDPRAPYIQFIFEMNSYSGGVGWPFASGLSLHVDNLHYSNPSYYVSPSGNNSTGRSPASAFHTVQRALDVAHAGDVIVVMSGHYHGGSQPAARFVRPGVPDAWISLRNYPGQTATLYGEGWNVVQMSRGWPGYTADGPSLAYLEVRGMQIQGGLYNTGIQDAASTTSTAYTNTNGIGVDGRHEVNRPHHIRLADNRIFACPGGGIGIRQGDWVFIEGNVIYDNCWTTVFATSGISVYQSWNFSGTSTGYRNLLRRNLAYANECFRPWVETGTISDGNGIIIDDSRNTQNSSTLGPYFGRTLIQSNLCFGNGGSGIHTFLSDRVDIVNNTAYNNNLSASINWGQMFAQDSSDVRFINNVMVAPHGKRINAWQGSTQVVYTHNIYHGFGSNPAPVMGPGDLRADPRFVNAANYDFRLASASPGFKTGTNLPIVPRLDFGGTPRGLTGTLDRGAFESPAP